MHLLWDLCCDEVYVKLFRNYTSAFDIQFDNDPNKKMQLTVTTAL